jgi:hypothetical protein
MAPELISYIKKHEEEVYYSCLSKDWHEYEKGEGIVVYVFDEELYNELPSIIKLQIETDYKKHKHDNRN